MDGGRARSFFSGRVVLEPRSHTHVCECVGVWARPLHTHTFQPSRLRRPASGRPVHGSGQHGEPLGGLRGAGPRTEGGRTEDGRGRERVCGPARAHGKPKPPPAATAGAAPPPPGSPAPWGPHIPPLALGCRGGDGLSPHARVGAGGGRSDTFPAWPDTTFTSHLSHLNPLPYLFQDSVLWRGSGATAAAAAAPATTPSGDGDVPMEDAGTPAGPTPQPDTDTLPAVAQPSLAPAGRAAGPAAVSGRGGAATTPPVAESGPSPPAAPCTASPLRPPLPAARRGLSTPRPPSASSAPTCSATPARTRAAALASPPRSSSRSVTGWGNLSLFSTRTRTPA